MFGQTSNAVSGLQEAESGQSGDRVEAELELGQELSVIKLVDALIEKAHSLRASDVHLDPRHKDALVRLRVDGVLSDAYVLPAGVFQEIISRVKILAGLRTDEHQMAQDGRFRVPVFFGEGFVDIRVSIMPTYYGENAVLRLLSDRAEDFSLESLGFSPDNRKKIIAAIKKPYGMVLATGPTGSGKTTTLYTLVKMLNSRKASIVTIEDPIEYAITGISQIQANERTGLDFARGLRSILRQDPDIIMVGEIRDAQTASLAVNTALTGHLLLSTLHTNDAATTLPRLLDLKAEAYLIASTVNIAIGQRLVRRICPGCKTSAVLSQAELANLRSILPETFWQKPRNFYFGAGCEACGKTGYLGRVGIQEVMPVTGQVREAVLNKAPAQEIFRLAVLEGMVPMVLDGFEKATLGMTTAEEVLRTLRE